MCDVIARPTVASYRWKDINKEAPVKNLVNSLASAKCINLGSEIDIKATSITVPSPPVQKRPAFGLSGGEGEPHL